MMCVICKFNEADTREFSRYPTQCEECQADEHYRRCAENFGHDPEEDEA